MRHMFPVLPLLLLLSLAGCGTVERPSRTVSTTLASADTDLRLASTGAMRRLMAQNPSEFDPRKFFGETIKAMRDVCIARYEAFGTAGNASKIKPISLEAMYQRYLKGELNAKVN